MFGSNVMEGPGLAKGMRLSVEAARERVLMGVRRGSEGWYMKSRGKEGVLAYRELIVRAIWGK